MLIGGIIASTQTSFFVSAAGNDSNPGTQSLPWLTIAKANAHTFLPGDSLYFKGGDTFSGSVLITISGTPDSSHKVIVGAYGTGRPIISCGDSYGIRVVDKPYVEVRGTKVVGSGITYTGVYPSQTADTTSTGGGIEFVLTTPSTSYPGLVADDNEITGTRQGVYCVTTDHSATVGSSGLAITNNYIHDVSNQGVWLTGAWDPDGVTGTIHQNAVITGNRVENIPGLTPAQYELGGFPIRFNNASGTTFSGNLVKRSGWACSGLPVAILLVDVTNTLIGHNDISEFGTGGGDGHGIDPDLRSFNTIVEYNYVHDSNKCGLFNFSGTNTIWRYNIVERCNGCLRGAGTPELVYNNSFYNTTDEPVMALAFSAASVYNNLIVGKSGVQLIQFTSDTLVACVGNTYYTTGGSSFVIETVILSPTTYTSIAAFRAAGYEKHGGTDYGAYGDPLLTDAGNGTQQLMTNPVSHLAAYNIAISSPAIGAGINWATVGLTAPTLDWHGNAATTGTYDSGAVRYGST